MKDSSDIVYDDSSLLTCRSPELKRRLHRRTSKASQESLKLLRIIFPLLVAPLCITSFIFTCLYAHIYAREGSYGPEDWPKCLTVPNIGNLHLDNNRFCTSASNFAGQAYLSLLVAAGGLQLGLRDNDYLLFSSFTCIVGLLGITIYRESYPYFLDPHFMSTTLFTLSKYIHPRMYDDLSASAHLPPELKGLIPSSQVCKAAYRFNLAFLGLQYGMLALALLLFLLCLYASLFRPQRARPRVRLLGREGLVLFSSTALLGMLVMLVSKERVAELAIQVASNDQHDTSYPFVDNNLDLVSFTTLLALGLALYTACKPSLTPLLLCLGVSLINVTRSVPGLLGILAGYSGLYYPTRVQGAGGLRSPLAEIEYNLWSRRECTEYVEITNPGAFNLDPDAHADASSMCDYFVSSIIGQVFTWISVLCLAITAAGAIKFNPELERLRREEEEVVEEEEELEEEERGRKGGGRCLGGLRRGLARPLLLKEEEVKEEGRQGGDLGREESGERR